MRFWNKIRARLGRSVEGDLAEEMRLHRAMLEERFRARGMQRHRSAQPRRPRVRTGGALSRGQPRAVELCLD